MVAYDDIQRTHDSSINRERRDRQKQTGRQTHINIANRRAETAINKTVC